MDSSININFPPKIKKVLLNNYTIFVLFSNHRIKKFNFEPLLVLPHYSKLKNKVFFKAGKVDPGGYGISWDDECDLSENELWTNGELLENTNFRQILQSIRNDVRRKLKEIH